MQKIILKNELTTLLNVGKDRSGYKYKLKNKNSETIALFELDQRENEYIYKYMGELLTQAMAAEIYNILMLLNKAHLRNYATGWYLTDDGDDDLVFDSSIEVLEEYYHHGIRVAVVEEVNLSNSYCVLLNFKFARMNLSLEYPDIKTAKIALCQNITYWYNLAITTSHK